jgi:hypothetical protein
MSFASSMKYAGLCLAAALTLAVAPLAGAQVSDASVVVTVPAKNAPVLITDRVDMSKQVPLKSADFLDTKGAQDLGPAPADMKMSLQLELRRPRSQRDALDAFRKVSRDPSSDSFGKTLTPADFASKFGLAQSDLDTIKDTLTASGFTLGNVDNGRLTINFSGTVEQVNAALVTSIHLFQDSDGNMHYAPVGGWTVPQALEPAIGGINGLDNFSVPELRGFGGVVKDFAPGTIDQMAPLSKAPKKDAALHMEGELLHDFSFTGSNVATVFSEHTPTVLNVRLGGDEYPVTGSLTIKDETGKTIAFIKDVTACQSYNNGYGRSCTGQFTAAVAKTTEFHAIYSGDDNYRAVTQSFAHPDVGTGASIAVLEENPIAYQVTTAQAGTVYTSISWLGTGTQPTGTIKIEDEAKTTYQFGTITLPAAGSTTIASGTACTTAPSNGTCSYGCAGSLTSRYISCTLTESSLGDYLEYYEDNEQYAAYSGDGNYAVEDGLTYVYGAESSATVQPTISASTPTPATVTYGSGATESNTLTITGNSTQGAINANAALVESNNPQLGTMNYTNPTSCTATSGVCVFANSFVVPANANPGTYTVTYAYSGDSYPSALYKQNSTTGTITVVQQTPTFGPVIATPGSAYTGSSTAVTISASLGYTGSGAVPGTTAALGSIPTFVLNGVTYNATCTGTSSPLSCTASVPAATVAALSSGSYTITGSWAGDVNYGPVTATSGTLTIGNDLATLTASPTSTTYGAATTVTLTDVISVATGGTAPTGTVTITNTSGVTAITTINLSTCTKTTGSPSDTYTCSYVWTPPYGLSGDNAGVYTLLAVYSGDSNYAAVTAGTTFTINKATTTTTATNPIIVSSGNGGNAVFTVTVAYTGTGLPPTGNVTLTNAGNVFSEAILPVAGSTTSSGSITPATGYVNNYSCTDNAPSSLTVTCTITTVDLYAAVTSGDSYTFIANYNGDSNYGTSTYSDTLTASTNTALATNTNTATPTSVAYGSGATVAYKTTLIGTSTSHTLVGAQYELSGTPLTSSPVITTLPSATNSTCTENAVDSFVCTVSQAVPASTPVGTYTVTESFLGNSYYAGGTVTTATVTVTQATSSVMLSAATPGTSTAPVTGTTFTATMSPAISGVTVTFTDAANGFQTTAVTNASGVATTPTVTGVTAGLNNITASITGTTNYTAATSNTVPVYIGGILYTTTGLHNFSTDPGTTDGTKLGPYGVTVYNFTSSAQPLTFSFTNAASGAFSYVTNCPSTLAALASCAVQFYYAPPFGDGNSTTVGEFESASWNIAPNAGVLTGIGDSGFDRSGATTLPGTLAGKALLATASLSVSPLSYNFGSQAAGVTSNTESIVVTNNFGTPVAFTYTGPTTSEFAASSNCVSPLAGNSTCKINVTFSGSTPATYNDSIVITPSGGSAITSTLSGTIASNSGLTISSTSHSFGNVTDGTTATFGFSITNNSGASATVGVSYPTATGYTVSTNCGTTLAAAAVCNVNVTFAPTTVATLTDAITVSSSVPVVPGGTGSGPYSDVVSVTGNGVAGGSFTASSVNHNFGNVPVGTSAGIYGVELSNNTSSTVTLSLGAGFTNGANGFTIVATNCGSTLAVNANCELQFSFAPTATGAVSASYGISPSVTSGGSTYSAITLSGNGQ